MLDAVTHPTEALMSHDTPSRDEPHQRESHVTLHTSTA